MKIIRMELEVLNKAYSYGIDFNSDNSVNIITGPNGYGKTTILKIISAIGAGDLLFFYGLSFKAIKVFLEDKSFLLIEKQIDMGEEDADNDFFCTVSFSIQRKDEEKIVYSYNTENVKSAYETQKERDEYIYYLSNLSTNANKLDNERRANEHIVKNIGANQLVMVMAEIESYYIPAYRLHKDISTNLGELTISSIAKEMQKILEYNKMQYLSNAQKANEQMMSRLMEETIESYSLEEYDSIVSDLMPFADKIKKYHIENDIDFREYTDEKREVLTLNLQMIKSKIEFAKHYLEKLDAFVNLINDKKFSNKSISLDNRYGIVARNKQTGEMLDLETLSSGEMNEIIMAYDLIFSVKDNTIVLIDEPENSLHVAWLLNVVNDFEKIAKTKKLEIIAATHSPDIIGERSDRIYDLFRNNQYRLDAK